MFATVDRGMPEHNVRVDNHTQGNSSLLITQQPNRSPTSNLPVLHQFLRTKMNSQNLDGLGLNFTKS